MRRAGRLAEWAAVSVVLVLTSLLNIAACQPVTADCRPASPAFTSNLCGGMWVSH